MIDATYDVHELHGNHIQIGQLTFIIEVVPSLRLDDGTSILGAARLTNQRIYLNANLPPQLVLPIILHEVHHMLCEIGGIESTESAANVFGYQVASLLADNQWLAGLVTPRHMPAVNVSPVS